MKALSCFSPLLLLCTNLTNAVQPFVKPRSALLLSIRGGSRSSKLKVKDGTSLTVIGGDDDVGIDKSSTWSISDTTAKDFAYLGANVAFLAGAVFLCRTLTRTGGQAPNFITKYGISDPYATILLHVAFFVVGFLTKHILPPGLTHLVFSPPTVALLGTVFPAVESVRAALSDDAGLDDRTWLTYWCIHGIFQYSTEFMDQLALKYKLVYDYWHTFEVLAVLWLVLPLTDGATLIYNTVAQPYLLPLVKPIKSYCDGWIATLALTTINASYIWWFSFIFMSLPVMIKRYAVMGVGSIFPVVSTLMALGADKNAKEVMRWLTYWPCFGLLFLIMIGVEKFIGSFKGLYVVCLAATMYLMLPMFDGSTMIFRNVLVPILGQQELLLLRDAHGLAAQLFKQLPQHRQEGARQAAAKAFWDHPGEHEKKEAEA